MRRHSYSDKSARASGCSVAGDARRLRRRPAAKEHPAGGHYRPRVLMPPVSLAAVPVLPSTQASMDKRATASTTVSLQPNPRSAKVTRAVIQAKSLHTVLSACKTQLIVRCGGARDALRAPLLLIASPSGESRLPAVTLAVQSQIETHCDIPLLPVSFNSSMTYVINSSLENENKKPNRL